MKHYPSTSSSSLRLWQLISPTLPIGAYAYSQGLEYAVDTGWVDDEATASEWILGQVKHNLSAQDVPVFFRMYDAWRDNQLDTIQYWNQVILALRESSELRQEDCDLGQALVRVLRGLDVTLPEILQNGEMGDLAFTGLFSFACQHWAIDKHEAAHGLLWSWCENQVAAAIKLVPLGQTSGQRILSSAIEVIESSIESSVQYNDDDIGLSAPGVAIAGALHETQYSRLFRS